MSFTFLEAQLANKNRQKRSVRFLSNFNIGLRKLIIFKSISIDANQPTLFVLVCIWSIALSAIAVIDRDGFTPGFAEIIEPSII